MKQTLLQKIIAIILSTTIIIMPLSPVLAEGDTVQQTQSTESNLQQITPPPTVTPPPTITPPPQPSESSVSQPSQPSVPSLPSMPEPKYISEEQYWAPTQSDQNNIDSAAQNNTGKTSNGGSGDTYLTTGDANNNTNIANTGNQNISGNNTCCQQGATVVNSNNGANSTNTGSATLSNSDSLNQGNGGVIANYVDSATVTGNNSTSYNNGNSTLTTGNANTTGTIFNNINSNLAGVTVSEFNIEDDHLGDYVLDFAANCVANCGSSPTAVSNINNGSGSANTATSNTTNNDSTSQTNNGTVINDMTLVANSGDNTASFNTGGNSSIVTGDANVAANILNFVNNNLAGNVLLGVVNIFGDLIGDIILPDNPCSTCSQSNTAVANTNNGSGSTNTASVTTNNAENQFQSNDATIENNLVFNANTGGNSTSFNTGGDSSVTTGSSNINAQVLNIANTNISGGDWWLVIVNNAGQWIGQILGAPQGTTVAGSAGTHFFVDEYGQITAINANNGSNSVNSAAANISNTSTITQNNSAHVVNNINLSANTGNNKSSFNTGGDSSIVTGDAKIVANIINFVNNNIVGSGRLVVTFVNVFGNWIGDFVTPGQKKQHQNDQIATNSQNNSNHAWRGGLDQQQLNQGNTATSSNESNTQKSNSDSSPTPQNAVIASSTTPANETVDSGIVFATSNSSDTSLALVKGATSNNPEYVNSSRNKIKINLAWLVVIIPLTAGVYLLKKKIIRPSTL
ncbi:MAG: hypothetical protein KatS3mg089_0568 [Patescibacteria group bacterium]|nr:MAG: hypothetical protein KatS3mg089_0568 [Patescibacteria group bacterium]